MGFSTMDYFKFILITMLFYSFAITAITYSIPEDAKNYVDSFSDISSNFNFQEVGTKVQDSLETQTKIPLLDVGALVFYSGNIILDLLLNFAFAIPEMIGILVQGILFIFNIDTSIVAYIELFAAAIVLILYVIGLIQLVTGIRSGRVIA